eukprot:3670665-Prymnesium_polylepis.1
MPRTDAPTEAEQDTIDRDNFLDDRHAQQATGILRWKVGVETPLLLRSNPAAIKLCQSILDGTA